MGDNADSKRTGVRHEHFRLVNFVNELFGQNVTAMAFDCTNHIFTYFDRVKEGFKKGLYQRSI